MAQLHSSRTANHRPYADVYADATERLAATGFERALGGGVVPFATEDLYKTVLQLDTATEWALTAITPTWVQVGGDGLIPAADAPPLSPATVTLTDGATITWATAGARQNNARVTLGGNRTLDITGEVDGATGLLIVIQGAGGNTLTLPGSSVVINGGGGAVTLSTGAGDIDILTWYYDGTNFFWTIGTDYT